MKLKMLQPRIKVLNATRVPILSGNPNATPRISDSSGGAWAKIRARIMRRDCGICQQCKVRGVVTLATEIDHIIALANGGSNDDGNLQAICRECHTTKSRDEAGKAGR